MTEFNLPLLRKAVEWAESEARKPEVDREWFQRYYAVDGDEIERHCGTAYCIAGYVTEQAGGHIVEQFTIDGDPAGRAAMDLLGITQNDAWGQYPTSRGLFNPRNTIEDVREIAERIARRHGAEL